MADLTNNAAANIGVVCFFNSVKSWGGGEKWHHDLACRLQERGIKVMAITHKNSKLKRQMQRSGIELKAFSISNFSFLNPFKIIQLARAFKKSETNTLILNLPSDLKAAGLAARLARIPRIIYRRGSAIPIKNTLLNRLVFKYLVDDIIANSEETAKTILSNNPTLFDKNRIHIIYNGIDLAAFDNNEDCHDIENQTLSGEASANSGMKNHASGKAGWQPVDESGSPVVVIGNAGRFVRQKGQVMLLEVATALKARGVNFRMVIAGKGKLADSLRDTAKEKGIDDVVAFSGFANNIREFMKGIDIFVLPSLWEGFGYVLVEAMACNNPVVAFDLSSNPEIIDRDKTGFLIKPFDTKAMASKLEQLVIDHDLRTSMGKAGRQRVEEKFTIDKTCEKLIGVLLKG